MPDTIDIINLTTLAGYEDVYTLSGLAVGTPLVIQNQTPLPIHIHIGATKPDQNPIPDPADGTDYDPVVPVTAFVIIPEGYQNLAYIENGATGCWIDGQGPISVQVDT